MINGLLTKKLLFKLISGGTVNDGRIVLKE